MVFFHSHRAAIMTEVGKTIGSGLAVPSEPRYVAACVQAAPVAFDLKATLEKMRYHVSSIEVPGPAVDVLGQIAKKSRAYLVVGVVERDGGTLYCTVVTFAPDGRFLGKHRKLMPTGSERLVWGFGDGSTLPVFDTAIGRLGSVICWENYMPMLRSAMYAQRIQVYCAPTADGRP